MRLTIFQNATYLAFPPLIFHKSPLCHRCYSDLGFLSLRAVLEFGVSHPEGVINVMVGDPKISFEWTSRCGDRRRCSEARRQRHNSGPDRYAFAPQQVAYFLRDRRCFGQSLLYVRALCKGFLPALP